MPFAASSYPSSIGLPSPPPNPCRSRSLLSIFSPTFRTPPLVFCQQLRARFVPRAHLSRSSFVSPRPSFSDAFIPFFFPRALADPVESLIHFLVYLPSSSAFYSNHLPERGSFCFVNRLITHTIVCFLLFFFFFLRVLFVGRFLCN